jgi:CheY-like chemotaxis protein
MNRPLRVLLAEDNPVNQKVALRMLERIGYQADLVEDGLAVLEALRRELYDVVLMDMYMPKMDGIDAARQICREFHPSIRPRIIAITASTDEVDRQRCLEAGMDDYISKPIRMNELAQVLQTCHSVRFS